MELTRKEMLKLGLLGSAAFALPIERIARTKDEERLRRLPRPFVAELPIPEPLPVTRRDADTDFYTVTMRPGTADIIPGMPTPIWGYNGQFPGPMIRARRERKVVVDFVNGLPADTCIHNHGAYVDGDSDGHPEDKIHPGESKRYVYLNDETSRFQWYHDHTAHATAANVYRGLAGLYFVGDAFEDNLPTPQGEFSVPLLIQDRLFDADGGFLYPFGPEDHSANGVEGDVTLVNGKPWPRMEVGNRKYRFSVLNGANATPYRLALSSGRPFTVIGTEGGLIENPVTVRSLPVSPAERYEIIVDFSEYPVGSGPESQVVLKNLGGKKEMANVMRFHVGRRVRDDSTIPEIIRSARDQEDPTHQPADPSEAVRTRRWVFKRQHGFWSINGKIWDPDRIDARPAEGDVEIWEFINNGGGWIHPIHLHMTNFKILSRNGGPPRPWERGWKETVFLDGNETARVLIKFPRVPVEEGGLPGPFSRRFAYHCHVTEHEDHDMMLQFAIADA